MIASDGLGRFALVPPVAMLNLLRPDYQAMAVMIFGDVPLFDTVRRAYRCPGSKNESMNHTFS